jgi:DNA-directed RNA polymerase specialized sigma24 family protein
MRASDSPDARAWDETTRALRTARQSRRRGWFTTPKCLVERARQLEPQAVSALYGKYRLPVRTYLQQRGVPLDRAEDVTQGFFEGLIKRNDLSRVDPQRSFGGWLRVGAMHHLYNERAREKAGKRLLGVPEEIELRSQLEQRQEVSPERLLDRDRALLLIERAWARLRVEYEGQGKAGLFDHLKSTLCHETPALSDAQLCEQLGHSASYVGVARHHLKTSEFPAALLAEFHEYRARERNQAGACQAAVSAREEIRALLDALA